MKGLTCTLHDNDGSIMCAVDEFRRFVDSTEKHSNGNAERATKILVTTWQSGYCRLNKGECNLNQSKDDFLLNRWPRTIAETMATATKFMRFSQWIVLFSL